MLKKKTDFTSFRAKLGKAQMYVKGPEFSKNLMLIRSNWPILLETFGKTVEIAVYQCLSIFSLQSVMYGPLLTKSVEATVTKKIKKNMEIT